MNRLTQFPSHGWLSNGCHVCSASYDLLSLFCSSLVHLSSFMMQCIIQCIIMQNIASKPTKSCTLEFECTVILHESLICIPHCTFGGAYTSRLNPLIIHSIRWEYDVVLFLEHILMHASMNFCRLQSIRYRFSVFLGALYKNVWKKNAWKLELRL